MGMTQSIEDLVYFRAKRALELGCDGVVSSGLEAERLRASLGDRLLLVTPGIRPGSNRPDDDQQRVMTARRAVAAGADHLVIGRPITQSSDPIAVISALQQEIIRRPRGTPSLLIHLPLSAISRLSVFPNNKKQIIRICGTKPL